MGKKENIFKFSYDKMGLLRRREEYEKSRVYQYCCSKEWIIKKGC
jgi:hypothetical protein